MQATKHYRKDSNSLTPNATYICKHGDHIVNFTQQRSWSLTKVYIFFGQSHSREDRKNPSKLVNGVQSHYER